MFSARRGPFRPLVERVGRVGRVKREGRPGGGVSGGPGSGRAGGQSPPSGSPGLLGNDGLFWTRPGRSSHFPGLSKFAGQTFGKIK